MQDHLFNYGNLFTYSRSTNGNIPRNFTGTCNTYTVYNNNYNIV